MTKKKNPLTTNGWLKLQADELCSRIDTVLEQNNVNRNNFKLLISANVIRTMCDVTIIPANEHAITVSAPLIESYNPFDNKSYMDKTEKFIIKKYGFKRVEKLPNVRQYEFTF